MPKPTARHRTLTRTWTTLSLIGQRPRTLPEIAQELGVTTRTVRRDLEALEAAGFPLYNDRDDANYRHVTWHLLTAATVPARRAA